MAYISRHHLTDYQSTQISRPHGRSLGARIARWRGKLRERREMAALDERDLRDARLTRWDVERELAKPFWRD